VKRENIDLLEECERLQGIGKEAEASTHNNRHVRKVKLKKKETETEWWKIEKGMKEENPSGRVRPWGSLSL
jgi:hypothetical protein